MAKDSIGLVPLQNFNMGGLADSKWAGVKDSFYKIVGWDLHGSPGLLKVAQKMTKASGSKVTAFAKVAVNSSNGRTYWFSSTDGKIWEIDSSDNITLVHTTTPAAGGAGCLGALEYRGTIYWATESRLHKILATDAEGAAEWTANAVEDTATFGVTDALFHPMIEVNQVLYIGDGNQVAQVDTATFSANALDIKSPLRIKSLGKIGTDLLIGTWVADTITKTELIRWNTWSVSFTTSDEIPETGINAFLPADNMVLIQAGIAGNIYSYDGNVMRLYKRVPGDYSPTKYGSVHPYSVGNLNGRILFGFSNGSGNSTDQGVYQLGQYDGKYPYVMDMPYPISERSASAFVLTGIEIGAIIVSGFDVFVSWSNNGATFGIDKLDYSNKLDGAYLETRIMTIDREKFSTASEFIIAYQDMPASTAIAISYDKNYAGYVASTVVDDTQRKIVSAEEGVEATTLQLKWTITVDSNNAPAIESGGVILK